MTGGPATPPRLVFFGSGAFGLPTLRRLLPDNDLALVVSQPDRPAGRRRQLTPTPVAAWAAGEGLAVLKPPSPNDADAVEAVRSLEPDALVVIAYGHKLGGPLLEGLFAINLHGSLLPKCRGAAPINWAMIRGERETGVSVITLAATMDAGVILGQASTTIDPGETAGELHDRLAELGPSLVEEVLAGHFAGTLDPRTQDPAEVTQAPKLSKADATVDFDQPADRVRARIHGLTPWPGCSVEIDGRRLRLHRVEVAYESDAAGAAPGSCLNDGLVACGPGAIRLVEVHPPGRNIMSFDEYRRGHEVPVGAKCV